MSSTTIDLIGSVDRGVSVFGFSMLKDAGHKLKSCELFFATGIHLYAFSGMNFSKCFLAAAMLSCVRVVGIFGPGPAMITIM
jgi:hypothetical protein